jgi:hypothetical protein
VLLDNKKIKGEVYTLKLVTGEEVLGKIEEVTSTTITVHKPLILTIQPTEKGPTMAFLPMGLTYDPDVVATLEFKTEHILYMFLTPNSFEKQYTSQTTGIQFVT